MCNKGIGDGSHLAGRRRRGGGEFGKPGGTNGKGAQAIVCGLYAQGTNANITIYSGQIKSNNVTGYVYNPDVANERGMVYLYGGDVTHVTITFDPNGGTYIPGGTCQQMIVKATNSLLILPPSSDFSHVLYGTLSGWKDALGNSYTNNQVMNINEDLTLYAQWN